MQKKYIFRNKLTPSIFSYFSLLLYAYLKSNFSKNEVILQYFFTRQSDLLNFTFIFAKFEIL